MKNFAIIFLALNIYFISSCGTAQLASGDTENSKNLNTTGLYDSLADYLRNYPGVEVREFGGNDGEVLIRGGSNTITQDKRPLYVLNGSIIGRSYKIANSAIDANNIKRIEIKKSLSETNRYGKDGVNGVIEITTKNSM